MTGAAALVERQPFVCSGDSLAFVVVYGYLQAAIVGVDFGPLRRGTRPHLMGYQFGSGSFIDPLPSVRLNGVPVLPLQKGHWFLKDTAYPNK